MSNVVSPPDFVTIITNIAVFVTASGATLAAIWGTVRRIRSAIPEEKGKGEKVIGGAIMDTTTLLMWSESNRDVIDAIHQNTKEMMELRFAVTSLKDRLK